jgi:hypothetical protein
MLPRPHVTPVYNDSPRWEVVGYIYEAEEDKVFLNISQGKTLKISHVGDLRDQLPFKDLLLLVTKKPLRFWEGVTNFNN